MSTGDERWKRSMRTLAMLTAALQDLNDDITLGLYGYEPSTNYLPQAKRLQRVVAQAVQEADTLERGCSPL